MATRRPTGTVTFLFSDIEGSTVRWERNHEAMESALARHDKLMRRAIEARGGYVFKTIGDAFCAAFARPSDAISAALDAQRAIASEDFAAVGGIGVRMALHAGQSAERDGDYFGPTVNRVARLLAAGHGGQVLVSGACTELLKGATPPQCSLRDLGEHRLKDLAAPEHVFQLIAPDRTADFSPLRSLGTNANNLPLQLTSFVGRESEITEIAALVDQHRIVTLTGSGGVGKTRTSLQVAANLLERSGEGVWFIELAPLTSGEYIPSAVAQALGMTLAPEGDPLESLICALKEKHTLLVFDNCEHLVAAAARAISGIVHGCPKIKVLASSRQGLGVEGEVTYRLPSLTLPVAIALFTERARGADNRFALTGENAPIVADICRRLDGIPLAVELASSRVKMLSPRQLLERLDERLRVLTGGSRDVLPRQHTLRATIDWSHDLLDERERVLFRRVGVFVNGFTLEGAVAVGSGDMDETDVFDVLASLVDKSLVLAEPYGDAVRYRLLESTRAYAAEKLNAASERDLMADRHLGYLHSRFTELWEQRERTGQSAELYAESQIELEDVRLALDGALRRSKVVGGGELLALLDTRWQAMGLEAEGLARCEAYLAALPASELRLRSRLSSVLSVLLADSGHNMAAYELANEAIEQARASGDTFSLANALGRYSSLALHLHRVDDAARALAQAEAIPGTSVRMRVRLLEMRAQFSQFCGDLDTAAGMYEQLRTECRSYGNTRGELTAALELADTEHARGQPQRAIALVREMLPRARSGSDKGTITMLLLNLAGYLAAVADLSGAVAAAREAIGIRAAREPGHTHVAIALEHLALVFAFGGDLARAARLEGYSAAAFERLGFRRESTENASYERLNALLNAQLASHELTKLIAEGAALSPEAAIALALEEFEPA